MKRKLFSLFLILAIVLSLTACGNNTTDNGFINNDKYRDTTFWEGQNLDLVSNVTLQSYRESEIPDESPVFSGLSQAQTKKTETLKKAIVTYFLKNYNIDFSEKLSKQKVTFFSSEKFFDSIILGYVDLNDPNTLHLHVLLNSEYEELFETTYVHETLHQLGFKDDSGETTYIVEGIVDAYTDLIMTTNFFEPNLTDIYFEPRQLGYQIIAADKDLPNIFINGLSFQNHINASLEKYTQNFSEHKNPSSYLNKLLGVFIAINSNTAYSDNRYFYAFDAQTIIQRFCQSQKCSDETIKYIRRHYIIEDFENLIPVDLGNDTYTVVNN